LFRLGWLNRHRRLFYYPLKHPLRRPPRHFRPFRRRQLKIGFVHLGKASLHLPRQATVARYVEPFPNMFAWEQVERAARRAAWAP
jgi:hypothetical protein